MEPSNSLSSDMEKVDIVSNQAYLPPELLEKIFKHLKNVRDLRVARSVCRDWHTAATPLFLREIDEIVINFCVTGKKLSMYHRALFDKYREKQRQIPNRKLCEVIYNEISAVVEMDDENDTTSLLSTYCDYIESGGTIKYTNFDLSGIKLEGDEVSQFFNICGLDIKTLVLTVFDEACNQPIKLSTKCQDVIQKDDRSRIKSMVFKYCPNLENLTFMALKNEVVLSETSSLASSLDGEQKESDINDEFSTDDEKDVEDQVEDMSCLTRYGAYTINRQDELFNDIEELPPRTKIHTIRLDDQFLLGVSDTMCVFDLFLACPELVRASNFGSKETEFQSCTFNILQNLIRSQRMETITELFLRHLDSFILGSVLSLHNDFHLKILKVNYLVVYLAEHYLLRFLEAQSSTLETIMCGLNQKKYTKWSYDNLSFPEQMPKLIHLRIGLGAQNNTFGEHRPKQVAPIDWKKQFPSLKTLMLPELASNVTIASFFDHSHANEPLTTVTGLELPAGLTANLMARAGFLFPHVTELAVGYQTVDSLRQIWVMWPQLESLHLSVVDHNEHVYNPNIAFLSLDALLTGFNDLQMKLAKVGQSNLTEKPKFPSISNLKYLRELTIYAGPYRTHSGCQKRVNWRTAEADVMTDISMIHALMKLPSLKYLDISEHLYKISPVVDMEFCDFMKLLHEDNVNYRKNYTVMSHYRGREEAHPMCRKDVEYKDK